MSTCGAVSGRCFYITAEVFRTGLPLHFNKYNPNIDVPSLSEKDHKAFPSLACSVPELIAKKMESQNEPIVKIVLGQTNIQR